jgi:hypothetical protein
MAIQTYVQQAHAFGAGEKPAEAPDTDVLEKTEGESYSTTMIFTPSMRSSTNSSKRWAVLFTKPKS